MSPASRSLIPPTEADRLIELASLGVVNTPDEGVYDGIAEIAAALFEVPIALVSLMEADRQWFKAKIGTDICETPRDIAFCAHTVLQARTMVVEDLALDPRFLGNPLVTDGPRVRFYAGTPLITNIGECVGTICLLDHQPRRFEAARFRLLERLARQTVELMEAERMITVLSNARRGVNPIQAARR